MRDQFTFSRTFWEAISPLPKTVQVEAIMALCAYALDDVEPDGLSPMAAALFMLVRPSLDASAKMSAGGKKRAKRPQPAAEDPAPQAEPREEPAQEEAPSEKKAPAKPPAPPKKARAPYGWVKLTDAEYERLCRDLGEAEATYWIRLVDETAQSTYNKNGWKDWNLTVRRAAREKWGSRRTADKASARNAQYQSHDSASVSPIAQAAIEAMLQEDAAC
nr:MAG TPA: hypothetical protein [Caudoviricetes sp.]